MLADPVDPVERFLIFAEVIIFLWGIGLYAPRSRSTITLWRENDARKIPRWRVAIVTLFFIAGLLQIAPPLLQILITM